MDLIILKEHEIQKLTESINFSKSKSNREKILNQIHTLKFEQETYIMEYLETTNEEFIEKLNLNFDLLENDNIIFAVSQEGGNPISYYETELKGEIHANGFLYFTTTKTNSLFNPFSSHAYPTHFSGVINYFGETQVRAIKKDFKLFGSRVPQKFKGAIDKNGNVDFKSLKSYFELDGHTYVRKIIADPFSGNESKRETFISNRIELKRIISDFKLKITTNAI